MTEFLVLLIPKHCLDTVPVLWLDSHNLLECAISLQTKHNFQMGCRGSTGINDTFVNGWD